jgi:hypothetical protein
MQKDWAESAAHVTAQSLLKMFVYEGLIQARVCADGTIVTAEWTVNMSSHRVLF